MFGGVFLVLVGRLCFRVLIIVLYVYDVVFVGGSNWYIDEGFICLN